MKKRMPAVLLASGSGSNLQSIIDLIGAEKLDVDLRLVLSNNPDAFALERAKQAGIATWANSHKNYPSREAFDNEVIQAIIQAGISPNPEISSKFVPNQARQNEEAAHTLKASEAGCVILAGYMRLLSPVFIQAFAGRIVNIHPALLPSFTGAHGGADAQAYGVKISGCSVHFVDEIMDHGPIIIQAAVPHQAGEELHTLMNRIHLLEHKIFPQALQWLSEDRLELQDRVVSLLPPKEQRKNTLIASVSKTSEQPWLVSPALEHFA